jgi:hypothetical protein
MTPEHLKMQQEAIDTNDADLAYFIATMNNRDTDLDVKSLQQVVMSGTDATLCWLFAMDVHGADITALNRRGDELEGTK